MADNMTVSFDPSDFLQNMVLTERRAYDGAMLGLQDCLDELVRISSEIAPTDKGVLQRSHSTALNTKVGEVDGTVEYSVSESNGSGDFNYALWIHEGEYNLGAQSLAKPGTTGWSGTNYTVGNKYLERPLKGEEESFYRHIADEVRTAMGY